MRKADGAVGSSGVVSRETPPRPETRSVRRLDRRDGDVTPREAKTTRAEATKISVRVPSSIRVRLYTAAGTTGQSNAPTTKARSAIAPLGSLIAVSATHVIAVTATAPSGEWAQTDLP